MLTRTIQLIIILFAIPATVFGQSAAPQMETMLGFIRFPQAYYFFRKLVCYYHFIKLGTSAVCDGLIIEEVA